MAEQSDRQQLDELFEILSHQLKSFKNAEPRLKRLEAYLTSLHVSTQVLDRNCALGECFCWSFTVKRIFKSSLERLQSIFVKWRRSKQFGNVLKFMLVNCVFEENCAKFQIMLHRMAEIIKSLAIFKIQTDVLDDKDMELKARFNRIRSQFTDLKIAFDSLKAEFEQWKIGQNDEMPKIKFQNSEFQNIEPACAKFEAERTNPKFQSSPTSDNDFLNCETLSTQIQVVSESKYCQSAANGLTETVAETDLVLATVRLEITSRSVSPYGPKSELLGQELDPHGEISSMEVLNPKFQSSPASDNDFLNCETLPQGPLVSESNDCHSSANSLTRTVAETDMVFAAVRAEITSRSVSPHVGLFRRKFELHALDTGCLIRIFVTYKFRGIVTFSMELSTDVPCTVKTVSWWIIELDRYIYQKVTITKCTISNRLIKAC